MDCIGYLEKMIHIQNKNKCNGCHACALACPQKCIEMQADKEGFLYPYVDESICIHCGRCVAICPNLSVKEPLLSAAKAYAIINQRAEIREKSSSGGVFYALAEEILRQNGAVFGASFDEENHLRHTFVETIDKLPALMGSKYIQSEVRKSYVQVKKFLQNERRVLFVGTPCQIAGLQAFLGKTYEALLCVDIVCHGVPSPKLWEKYLASQEKKYGGRLEKISFRDKSTGWRAYSVKMQFANGKVYQKMHEEDEYMRLFLSNICLRPSCYACQHKGINRRSDLTLADCWGAERILNEVDDDRGISFVLAHTAKGIDAIQAISKMCQLKVISMQCAINENPSAVQSATMNMQRDVFFNEMEKISIKKAAKKYAPTQYNIKEKAARYF